MNAQVRYHQRRLADMAAALRLARTQTSREQGPPGQLAQHQQQRLNTIVRHAATHSPFYRRASPTPVRSATSASNSRGCPC